MLRRLLLTFSLIVSFGLAQIGAVTHEISHYTDASAENQQEDYNKNSKQSNQPSHNHTCEKCVGYAEIGSAISSSHIALSLASTPIPITSSQLQNFTTTKPRTYSARAPPSLV